ncbi:hypothetical protein TBK1r_22320 [Stieleria magnilauensis]|uniref:Uncharacterized protein n=1 Tax=Stieleria magnilauensis TaxID=2527963 RepID=A0ABX5XMT5_9BACT|nr:hypothetical protein TBK1r_22320 [Planctomycetes bacterium TBK1r]
MNVYPVVPPQSRYLGYVCSGFPFQITNVQPVYLDSNCVPVVGVVGFRYKSRSFFW